MSSPSEENSVCYGIFIYRQFPNIKDEETNKYKTIRLYEYIHLKAFNFIQRQFASKSLRFGSRTIIQRLKAGIRASIKMDNTPYCCHVYIKRKGLAAAIVTNADYPAKLL